MKSISEWPASDRMASDPVMTPTIALATVRPAEAAIEVSATRSFTSCMARAVTMRLEGVDAAFCAPCMCTVYRPKRRNEKHSHQRGFTALFDCADDGMD